MLTITRALARQLRAVLRKSALAKIPRGLRPPIVFQGDRERLRVRAHHPDVSAEYHEAGSFTPEVIALPAEALDEFAGRSDTPITLESTGPEIVQARWDDGGVPQVREYRTSDPDSQPPFPELPEQWTDLEPGFRNTFRDAAKTAAQDSIRYALQRLQLRGGTGEIVGTDGRQFLVQTGFSWPWTEDLLVPPVGVFACRELSQDAPIAIGRTATHVCVRVGSWTFLLCIDSEGRFPQIENVLPRRTSKVTTGRLSQPDAEFLARTLPRLPGQEDENAPVTVDLHGTMAVRAKAEGQQRPTEILLQGSEVLGPPVRCCVNRRYLARALHLGFTEIRIVNADVPVVCQDGRRTYAWMPLGKDGILAPSEDALRIASPVGDSVVQQPDSVAELVLQQQPARRRRKVNVTTPSTNESPKGDGVVKRRRSNEVQPQKHSAGLSSLIEEAEALKSVLRDTYGRASRLLAALQRHRRQSKRLATTLTSLRQLQHFDQ